MNIKYLLPMLIAVIFGSCQKESIIADSESPITFSSSYVGNSTSRALGDINNLNVKESSFYVYGNSYDGTFSSGRNFSTIFDKQIVSYDGSKWCYSPVKYWDSEKSYTFTGVMPNEIPASTITYTSEGKISITNIPLTQPIIDQSEQKVGIDYLVSRAVDDCGAGSGTVYLQFKHILSRFSVYVYTGDNTANVTLNSMSIYLPEGTATYNEINHSGPISNVVDATTIKQVGDEWTWSGFTNKTDGVGESYKKYSLLTDITPSVVVPYYGGIPSTEDAKLMPVEFFMAPIDKDKFATKEDLQLYMELSFHVKYSDGIEQDFIRNTPVLIHDLHSFTQNYKTNLFVKLLSENDIIAFNVMIEDYENTTNHWIDQYGYSFNLPKYSQTFDGTFPQDEVGGILYDYGNTDEGDSKTKMTYKVKSLTLEGETTPVAENLPLVFSKWSSSEGGTYSMDTQMRTKDYPYGKFTVDLTGISYTSGTYDMIIENSMGDVRSYKIKLTAPAYMAFTITVGNNDKYTIPFVTYETATAYWKTMCFPYLKSGGTPITFEMMYGLTEDECKETIFPYPSDLRIYWGDNSSYTSITKGTACVSEDKLTHIYTEAGDYQIKIYSDARYSESQIPQINWGSQATQNNPIASITNSSNGSTDTKIKSIDTPVLRIYDEWDYLRITFGASALAASDGSTVNWQVDVSYPMLGGKLTTIVKSSPITAMFHNSSIQHTADNLFIYNGTYARAADFTFLMCPRLSNIGPGMFDYCSNIVSMISTFDGDGNQIKAIPDGLFDYLTGNVYFFQTFTGCPLIYIPSDLFDHCGSGSVYGTDGNLGGGVTHP